MRAAEFLTESEQLEIDVLAEGPLGSLAKGIGKAAGGLAKGVGAVAGGVAGLGSAFKKGYQSGKAVVSGDEVPAGGQPPAPEPATPQTNQSADATKTAADTDAGSKTAGDTGNTSTTATDTQKQPAQSTTTNTTVNAPSTATTTQSTATAADPNATPKPTMVPDQPAADTTAQGKETEYSKALKFVKGLPVNKQKDIINMLQKNPKVVAAMNKTSSKPAAEPAAAATGDQPADDQPQSGMPAGRFGQEMGRLAKPLAGADSETPGAAIPQKAGNRPQGGGRVSGQLSTDPRAVKRREQRAAKKTVGVAQPDLTDPNVPISAAIRQRQAQGLAAGYRNPNKMIREGFSLFRKQQ